jgi:hypothetical protein
LPGPMYDALDRYATSAELSIPDLIRRVLARQFRR